MADVQARRSLSVYQPLLQDCPHSVHHHPTVAVLHVRICVPVARSALQRCCTPICIARYLVQDRIIYHPCGKFNLASFTPRIPYILVSY